MTATATRLVVFAGPTQNPREPSAPQRDLVQGVVGVRISPQATTWTEGPLTPPADFWDFLAQPDLDHSAYVVLHEAELQSDGTIVIKRDLFGPGDYPHTWAGWPIPGDPWPPDAPILTPLAALSPQSREFKALAPVRAAQSKTLKYKGTEVKLEKPK